MVNAVTKDRACTEMTGAQALPPDGLGVGPGPQIPSRVAADRGRNFLEASCSVKADVLPQKGTVSPPGEVREVSDTRAEEIQAFRWLRVNSCTAVKKLHVTYLFLGIRHAV